MLFRAQPEYPELLPVPGQLQEQHRLGVVDLPAVPVHPGERFELRGGDAGVGDFDLDDPGALPEQLIDYNQLEVLGVQCFDIE